MDSPLSVGAPKVGTGEPTQIGGGPEADVEDARTVLISLASDITRMGDHGVGQTTKTINQVLCGPDFMAVAGATQLVLDAALRHER